MKKPENIRVRTDGPDGLVWVPYAKKKARDLIARCLSGPPSLADAVIMPNVQIFIRAFRVGATFVEIKTASVASPVLYWGQLKRVNGGAAEVGLSSYTRRTDKLDREPAAMSFLDARRASYRIVLDSTLSPKVRLESRQTFACAPFDPSVGSDTYRDGAEGFATTPKFVRAPSGAKDEPTLCVAHVTGQREFPTRAFVSLGTFTYGPPDMAAVDAPVSPDGSPYSLELQGYVGGLTANARIYAYGYYRDTAGARTFDTTRPGSLTPFRPFLGAKLALRRPKDGTLVREIDLYGLVEEHFEPLSAYPASLTQPASSMELAPAYGATSLINAEFPSRYFYQMPEMGDGQRWELGTSKYGFAIVAVRHVAAGALSGSVLDRVQTHVDVRVFTYKGALRQQFSRTFTRSVGGVVEEKPDLVLVEIGESTSRCVVGLTTLAGTKLVVLEVDKADVAVEPPAGTWLNVWSMTSPPHVLGSGGRTPLQPGLWRRDEGYAVTKFGIGKASGRAVRLSRRVITPGMLEERRTLLFLSAGVAVDTLETHALAAFVYFGADAAYIVRRELRTVGATTEQRLVVLRRSDKQQLAATAWGIEPEQLVLLVGADLVRNCWVEQLYGDTIAVGKLVVGKDESGAPTYAITRTKHTYLTSKTVTENIGGVDVPVEYLLPYRILEDG